MPYVLIVFGILTRILPHPANLTAVGAVGIFSGSYGPKRWFWVVPLSIMLVSDLMIGLYTWQVMASVYIAFVISGFLGYFGLRNKRTINRIIFISLLTAIIFYLITNFAVWAWTPMYTKDWNGLWQSYAMAVPFFRNSLIGDLAYTLVLFGAYETYRLFKPQTPKIAFPIISNFQYPNSKIF